MGFTHLKWLPALVTSWVLFHSPVAFPQTSSSDRVHPLIGTFRIAGTVVSAKGGNPLARGRVTIVESKNPQNTQSFVTSEDGHFEFHVIASKFSLQGAKRGYITSAYNRHDQFSTAIVTGAGLDTENLVLRLSPAAVIAGKILDEAGEPVRNAQVTVYREDRFSGVSRVRPFLGTSTDDQGTYEVTPLDEGTYFVSVTAAPWYAVHPVSAEEGAERSLTLVDQSLDVAYPITYYAGATEAEDATPIPVRGGDHLEVDIRLTPVPALRLLFHVAEDGSHGIRFPLLQKSAFDGMQPVRSGGMQMVSPGVYEMTGVAAGRYTIGIPNSAGQLKEPTEVDLRNGQELDVSSAKATSKVKATVEVLGETTPPSKLQVALRNSKERVVAVTEADANGEVHFEDVSAGKYEVLAGSPAKAYSVVRITSDGHTTSGHTLSLPPGASLTVSLSLVGSSVTVEGFVKQAGKAVPGAMVVLIPKHPDTNHELFRRDQSDLDGSFSLPNVIPGSYTLIAIRDGWDLDWGKPGILARYGQNGQEVTVGDRMKGTMRLSSPVEVQPRD